MTKDLTITAAAQRPITHTLVLLKPDALERRLVGECLSRFEAGELEIVTIKRVVPTAKLVREHYRDHAKKPYFQSLLDSMVGKPVFAACLGGADAVIRARDIAGPFEGATSGTIRGDLCESGSQANLVHTSDSEYSAGRELYIWFQGLPADVFSG